MAGERPDQREIHPAQPDLSSKSHGSPSNGDAIEVVESEAETLRKELALFQAELDAIQDRVAAIHRESSSLAEALRRQGEEQAREIIARAEQEAQQIVQRAVAKAELVELRAKVRAEETRARAVARLWSHMEASRGSVIGGRRFTVETPVAHESDEPAHIELKETGDSAELDRESHPEGDAGAGVISGAGVDMVGEHAPDEGAVAEQAEITDTQPMPRERRFQTAERLSFASMMALEETVRSFEGVAAASITPMSTGGTLLCVVSDDPESVVQRLADTPGLPAFQETT